MKNVEYAIPEYATAEDVKMVRKMLGMTQRDFANLIRCSKPTVERWESGREKITGPIVLLLNMLKNDRMYVDKITIQKKEFPLRLRYMNGKDVCTLIDVNEIERYVKIKNYTDHPQFRAFGINDYPTFCEYEEFLESRCFPRTRDKMKLVLRDLNLPFYDPLLIIEKTEGRMSEDNFWIKIER